MPQTTLTVIYLIAAVLFILSLGGLSHQETARRGNTYGIIGMVLALAATMFHDKVQGFELLAGAGAVGGAIGAVLAVRVVMTAMPQLVAILHSFVGLAAVLVGLASYLDQDLGGALAGLSPEQEHGVVLVHHIEIWLGVAIGAITFTGSVIAWAKLRGSLSGKPLLLPGRHLFNLLIVGAVIGLAVPFVDASTPSQGMTYLLIMTGLTALMGMHLVLAIGGADMPVVVSLLNSYSGWAAAAAGFMLSNDLLIITGALVGSSGAILSFIMCRAMNRSILSVVFGGFGTGDKKPAGPAVQMDQGDVQKTDIDAVVAMLDDAKSVIIVPGYGLAVARAQHLVRELALKLREGHGVNVRYAVHPVAGRLPGHMNVLLAEAGVAYDIVLEMDEINDDFPRTDVVLVVGANDIVNPGAEDDESSPIYGMPVLQAWKAKTVVVLKRGMGSGYAGVQNPLFFHDNTYMLFGDAKDSIQKLNAALE